MRWRLVQCGAGVAAGGLVAAAGYTLLLLLAATFESGTRPGNALPPVAVVAFGVVALAALPAAGFLAAGAAGGLLAGPPAATGVVLRRAAVAAWAGGPAVLWACYVWGGVAGGPVDPLGVWGSRRPANDDFAAATGYVLIYGSVTVVLYVAGCGLAGVAAGHLADRAARRVLPRGV